MLCLQVGHSNECLREGLRMSHNPKHSPGALHMTCSCKEVTKLRWSFFPKSALPTLPQWQPKGRHFGSFCASNKQNLGRAQAEQKKMLAEMKETINIRGCVGPAWRLCDCNKRKEGTAHFCFSLFPLLLLDSVRKQPSPLLPGAGCCSFVLFPPRASSYFVLSG